jgi:hypothetical protein
MGQKTHPTIDKQQVSTGFVIRHWPDDPQSFSIKEQVICLIHNLLADTEIVVGADRDCLELELSCNRVEGMGTKGNGVERGRGPVTTQIEQVDNLLKDLCRKAHGVQ